MSTRHTALAIALAATLFAADAQAAGLRLPNVGTSRSGPAHADAAATYWNPAMLTRLERPELLVSGALVLGDVVVARERRATYQRADSFDFELPIDPTAIDPSKTGAGTPARANPLAPAPAAYGAAPLGPVHVGVGVGAPFGAILDFGDEEHAARWQLERATILAAYMGPAVAWQPTEWLSVGAGASLVLGYASLAKTQDFAALDDVGAALANSPIDQPNGFGAQADPGLRELDVMARRVRIDDAIATSASFHAGLAIHPTDDLTIAAVYHHGAPMTFVGSFQLDMDDDFFTQDLASKGLAYDPLVTGDASLSFELPRDVLVAADWAFAPGMGVALTLGWTQWSVVDVFDVRLDSEQLAQPELGLPHTQRLALERRWVDSFMVELSGRARPLPWLDAWASLGFQSAASPDATVDAASPDGDRVVANLGAAFPVTGNLTLAADAELQKILPRAVAASDYDLGNGTYDLTLLSLGLHGTYRFE